VFNLADTAIVSGVAILAFYLLFSKEEDGERVESHDGLAQS
jgi:lipoprotein signal peptidase